MPAPKTLAAPSPAATSGEPFPDISEELPAEITDENIPQEDPEEQAPPDPTQSELAEAEQALRRMRPTDLWSMQQTLESLRMQAKLEDKSQMVYVKATIFSESGAEFNITQGGPSISWCLEQVAKGIKFSQERFKMTTKRPNLIAATVSPNGPPAVPQGLAPAGVASVVRADPPPTNPVPGSMEQFLCVYIEVAPQPNGKTKVSFFGNQNFKPRDQYLTISIQGTPEEVLQTLKPVEDYITPDGLVVDHFKSAWNADVNFIVQWKYGRPNPNSKKGEPFKDLVALYPPA